jgi:integrase
MSARLPFGEQAFGDLNRLQWVNFQVFRRTYSSLSRQQGIDPKTVADQCGHGLGVNLDVYTRVPLEDRYEAVRKLEKAVLVN